MADEFVSHIQRTGSRWPEEWRHVVPGRELTTEKFRKYTQEIIRVVTYLEENGVSARKSRPDAPFWFDDDGDIGTRIDAPYIPADPKQFDPNSITVLAMAKPIDSYVLDYFLAPYGMRQHIKQLYWRKKDAPRIPSLPMLEYVLKIQKDHYRSLSDMGFSLQNDTPTAVLSLVLMEAYYSQFYRTFNSRGDYGITEFFFSSDEIGEFLREQISRLKGEHEDLREEMERAIGQLKSRECHTTIRRKEDTIEVEVYRTSLRSNVIREIIVLSASSPYRFLRKETKEKICGYPPRWGGAYRDFGGDEGDTRPPREVDEKG